PRPDLQGTGAAERLYRMDFAPAPARGEGGRRAGPICGPPPTNPRGMNRRSPTAGPPRANPPGTQAPSFREGCLIKCADACHAGRPQVAILWIHRGMSPPPEIDDFARLEADCSIVE